MPQETMDAVGVFHNATLSALRAQSALQPKASRLPPLIPTFAAKVALSGFRSDLPQFQLQSKLQAQLQVEAINAPTLLPKASKLLQVMPFLLPPSCLERGVFVSEQQICEDDLNRIVSMCQEPQVTRQGTCETQLWGVPWSEDQFIEQMVQFVHPTTVKSGLPEVLQSTIEFYKETSLQERLQYRASKLGFWLWRLVDTKESESELKSSMDIEVAQILKEKNLLLWEEMLRAVDYPDMDLVGVVERTGLWPTKFPPALVTVDELLDIAVR
jgi:hypothetical protein